MNKIHVVVIVVKILNSIRRITNCNLDKYPCYVVTADKKRTMFSILRYMKSVHFELKKLKMYRERQMV